MLNTKLGVDIEVRKAVIPTGLRRFLPATKALPKEMLPIVTSQFSLLWRKLLLRASGIFYNHRSRQEGNRDHSDRSCELRIFRAKRRGRTSSRAEAYRKWSIFTTWQKELGLGTRCSLRQILVGDEPFAVLLEMMS